MEVLFIPLKTNLKRYQFLLLALVFLNLREGRQWKSVFVSSSFRFGGSIENTKKTATYSLTLLKRQWKQGHAKKKNPTSFRQSDFYIRMRLLRF